MAKIAIIGAGAAGCFCAAVLSRMCPGAQIDVYERNVKPLMKLALTGGGRCNLTNTFQGTPDLREVYPRGYRFMKRALNEFGPEDARQWFREAGVGTVVEAGGRVFPESQDAMQVVRALLYAMKNGGVRTHCDRKILGLQEFSDCDAVVVTTGGGCPGLLQGSGIDVESCVPSLFGFRLSDFPCSPLAGISAAEVTLSLSGTKLQSCGPVLITRDGFSGPAVLKLSSYGARYLAENGYKTGLSVNWLGCNEQRCRELVQNLSASNQSKLLRSAHPGQLPSALWLFLMERSGLRADIRCGELGSKGLNKLVNILCNDQYQIDGRSPHKDEFVTCGGVTLGGVDWETMESKSVPGLFFAGEVLDIDAVTGGFNLQAAWTTGFLAARGAAGSLG